MYTSDIFECRAFCTRVQVVHNTVKVNFSKGFGDFDIQIINDNHAHTVPVIALICCLNTHSAGLGRSGAYLAIDMGIQQVCVHPMCVCVCVCAPSHMRISQHKLLATLTWNYLCKYFPTRLVVMACHPVRCHFPP